MAKSYAGGLAVIGLGVFILLGKIGVIGFLWHVFWPLLIIGPGVLLYVFFMNRTLPSAVLIPGGILATYGLMFQFCTIFGWRFMAYIWPGFLFGIAVGLYTYYLYDDEHPKSTMTVSVILSILSAVLFGFTLLVNLSIYVIAIVLIAIGAFLVARRPKVW